MEYEFTHSPEQFRMGAILEALDIEARKPADGDEVIAAFCRASIDLILEGPLRDAINLSLDFRNESDDIRDLTPGDLVNLMLRAFQKQLLRTEEDYADESYEKPSTWKYKMMEVLYGEAHDDWDYDMSVRSVQSNLASRHIPQKLFMISERERIGDNPSVLDIGCSDLQILKALNGHGSQGSRVDIVRGIRGFNGKNESHLKIVPQATRFANEMLDQSFHLGPSVGVDEINPNDPANSEWIFACSFRPKELRDPVRKQNFRDLHNVYVPDLKQVGTKVADLAFFEGKFDKEGMSAFDKLNNGRKFKIVTFITTIYMQAHQQYEMRELARSYLDDDGFMIEQEHGRPHPENPNEIEIVYPWGLNTYRMMVEDPKETGYKLHELLQMTTDRCPKIKPGASLSSFARRRNNRDLQELSRRAA